MRDFEYVPILKGRNGEYGALEAVPSALKAFLTPVIEIPPVDWNYAANRPLKTIDQHLQKVANQIERAWGHHQAILIDLMWIEDNARMTDGTHPAIYLFASVRNRGLQAVPVTGLLREQEYQQAYRDVIRQDGRGACLRIQPEDFADSDNLDGQIAGLLGYLNTPERETDLILDLRAINENTQLEEITSMIERLPRLTQWRSFALCGTAFPADLMGFPPSARSLIPRTEWRLWRELISTRTLARAPSFGDYAIANPQPSEVDPRVMRPSASIRYATDENWLILKGQNLRDHGFRQFHDVARALVDAPEYSGPDFSWGDRYISDCANRFVTTGNLTTWRKVGTSHHIAVVTTQLANFGAV